MMDFNLRLWGDEEGMNNIFSKMAWDERLKDCVNIEIGDVHL